MSNILLMNLNYVASDFLTSQTVSSALVAAPATNVYDKIRRSKVWRSAGNWDVTNANKAMVIQEAAGVNQTVNIGVANYATDALFLAAIKAALESGTSAATYTVVRDTTTLKIKITSNGSGGAIFRLMCTSVSFTAADLLGFSTGADRTGALTYTADSLRIHTSEWLRWDLGSAFSPEAFALIGTKKDGVRISSTATVTLQGNTTDVWTSPQYTQALTWDEDCIAQFDTAGLYNTGLRYWRLLIVDKDNPLGYVEISNVYLGEVFEPSIGAVQFPLDWQYVDYASTSRSEWGTGFADVRQVARQVSPKWYGLTVAEVEILEDFVELYGLAYPFWICLDPNEVFSSSQGRWVIMARFTSGLPGFPLERPGLFSSSWQFTEEA